MKRHPALVELSHDHHAGLFAALGLKRANERTAEKARAVFLAYWESHGNEHFRQEEEVLFPAYTAHDRPDDPLIARALGDHVAIRRLAHEVAEGPTDVVVLVELGGELAGHIRFEERTLFPLIERELPDSALERLGAALTRHGTGLEEG